MSLLSKVTKGKVKKPYGVVIYGPDGVGKSTFAAGAPNPIFLGTEQGTNNLDVARFPTPKNWADVRKAVKELTLESHDFKTLAIDSLDWVEPLVHRNVCEAHGVKSIELAAGGYGKGYGESSLEWIALKDELNELREKRSMHVILIAHCETIDFNDPQTQSNYKRYQLKLRHKDSAMWREWADAVFFANYETFTKKDEITKRTIAFADGARVIYTDRREGYDAKNRLGLPHKLGMSWDEFVAAAEVGTPDAPEVVIERINSLLTQVTDETVKAQVAAFVTANTGNAMALLAAENKLKLRVGA